MSDSPLFRKKTLKTVKISILLELCHWHKGGHFGILLQSLAGWGVHISFRHYMRERESPTDSTHILLPCGYRGMGWWQRRQAFPRGCLFDFAQKVIEHVTSTSGQDCRKTNRVVQVTWETNVSLCVCVYACVSSHFSCFPKHIYASFLLSFALVPLPTYCLPMQISGFYIMFHLFCLQKDWIKIPRFSYSNTEIPQAWSLGFCSKAFAIFVRLLLEGTIASTYFNYNFGLGTWLVAVIYHITHPS